MPRRMLHCTHWIPEFCAYHVLCIQYLCRMDTVPMTPNVSCRRFCYLKRRDGAYGCDCFPGARWHCARFSRRRHLSLVEVCTDISSKQRDPQRSLGLVRSWGRPLLRGLGHRYNGHDPLGSLFLLFHSGHCHRSARTKEEALEDQVIAVPINVGFLCGCCL